jgi:iron complex transport system ATP-binding protein
LSIDSNDAAIAVNQLSYYIAEKLILSNIKLSVEKGTILGVVGPNGSGKTTLLKLLSGQLRSNGYIQCEGEPLEQMSATERAKKIAVVNQLNESVYGLSLTRIVSMGRLPHQSLLAKQSVKDSQYVEQALLQVGLLDKGAQAYSSLSGGEQQRALIAQALVQAAPILILDEPINHLDVYYQYQILHLLKQLANEQGMTVVMSLHDLNLAAHFCDRLALLDNGKLAAFGKPPQVLTPQHVESVFRLPCKVYLINTEGDQPKRVRVEFMPNFAPMGIQ